MMETIASRHCRIYDTEKGNRASLEAYWQEIVYHCLSRKAYITRNYNSGDKLPADIYDSTAIMANAYFAAGMQAYMSSPQTKWFTLGLTNQALMVKRNILDYLRDTEDVLYQIINNSNFYQEDVEGYLSTGSVGTDILYSEDDIQEDVRFDCLPIENVIILNDSTGRVKIAYIEYEYNSFQAFEKFGNKISVKTRECYEKGDYNSKFKFLFCVFPREVYDQSKKDKRNMPFAALWIDREVKSIVREGGYREFPFFVSRFAKAKNSPYGYSPEMNVHADILMLNQMEKTNILAAQLAVAPPLEIPDEAFLRPFNFNPHGKNIKNAGFPDEHITPIVTGVNVPMGLDYVKYKQTKVAQAFYNDLFIMMESLGDKTATEVNILNNQRMQLLGSAVGNIMREKLSPVIHRVYGIAARLKKLPPLPPELANEDYQVNYISPLARAQKSLELNNLQQALAIIGQFAQIQIAAGQPPDVLDKFNLDEAADYLAEITALKPQLIRDDAEVDDLRSTREEAQALQQQMLMLQSGTETAKVATEADRNIIEAQKVGVK